MNRPSFLPPLKATTLLVKILVLSTGVLSLLLALLEALFPHFALTLERLVSLNLYGISHGYIWELFTYSFIEPAPGGITFLYLFHLAFLLYVLWIISFSLIERGGAKAFITLYLLGSILSGSAVLAVMKIYALPNFFLNSQVVLYTLLFAWMMLNPKAKIYIFFTLPFSLTWLLMGIWGMNLLIDLSQGNLLSFTAYIIAALVGYLFAVIVWQASSFSSLKKVEDFLHKLRWNRKLSPQGEAFHASKIYDFKTGEPILHDEDFMDAMLAKISLYGEDALSKEEKKRMKELSKKKTPSNPKS